MKLKRITFKLDKIFDNTQEVFFSNDNICLIGANASGKSTVLLVLYQIFQKRRHLRNNYFQVLESEVEFSLNIEEKKKLFISKKIHELDFNITMLNAHTTDNIFVSDIIKDELEYLHNKLVELKAVYIELLDQLKTSVQLFQENNDVDYLVSNISRAWLSDERYVQDVFDIIDNLEEFITNSISRTREIKNNYHRLSEHNSVFYPPQSLEDWNLEELHKYFSDCRIEGESNYEKLCFKFEEQNKELFDSIRNTGIEINSLIEHFQFIVKGDSYNNLYSYLEKTVINSAELIDNSNVYNLSKTIFDILLRKNYSKIYSYIYSMYEQELKNEIDFEFFTHLYSFKLLKKDYNSFGSMFDNQDEFDEDSYKDTDEYHFLGEINEVLDNLKTFLSNRDIVKDFSEDFSFTIFEIDKVNIMSNIEKQLLEYVPEFDGDIVDSFSIDIDLNIYVNESNTKFKIEELSQGRKWALRLNVLLSVLSENQIILIDEPAINLHERAQREILNRFLDMRNQIIYCTHSPCLLPLNVGDVGIYDIQKIDDSSMLLNINEKVEEGIIESFDMKFLQNIIVDRKRNVMLLQEELNSDIIELCENNQVFIDFVLCPVEYNPQIFINLSRIFSKYQFKSYYLVDSDKKKKKLIDSGLIDVISYSEFADCIERNEEPIELGQILGCGKYES